MKRLAYFSATAALLLGIGVAGWSYVWAQAGGRVSGPLALVPGNSFLVISATGDDALQAAWEKTAAYDAFRKSGLMDAVMKTVQDLSAAVPDEKFAAMMEIAGFVSKNGLTIAAGFPTDEGPALPFLTVVAHQAGPHGEALEQFVDQLGPDAQMATEDASGRKVTRVTFDGAPVELTWRAEGDHLVLTVGMQALEASINIAGGKAPNLAGTAAGKTLSAAPGFDRTGYFWLDFASLKNRFGKMPLPTPEPKTINDVLKVMGLDTLKSVLAQHGYKGRAIWSTVDVDAPGARTGLLGLADPKLSMTMADLPPLPANHLGFVAHATSLSKSYTTVLGVLKDLARIGPPDATEMLDNALDQMPQYLGCDLKTDILDTFGPVHCVYSDSGQGLLGADYGLLIQMKDAAKLRKTVAGILERIADEVPSEFVQGISREKHGCQMVTLQVGGGGFNPTFLIDDKWFCLGLSSQTVEAFALRLRGKLPTWKPDAETTEALAAVPKTFSSLSVAYPRPLMRGLISAAPLLMGMAQMGITQAQRFGQFPPVEFSMTPIDIPPAELVVAPLFPNVSWSVTDATGVHFVTRSSAPAIPLVGGTDGSTVAVSAVLVALLLPAVQQAREAARRTQSKNNLKQIALALHNFHDVFNHFPAGTIPSKKLKPEQRQSWFVQILPYIDQAPLYNQMDIDLRDSAEWNEDSLRSAIEMRLPTLMNPSNPAGVADDGSALTDYCGWAGVGKDAPTEKAKANKKGIFGYDRVTRMADITDGTSNTVMTSDVTAKTRGPWAQGGTATIRALTSKPYVNGEDGIGSPHVGGFHVGMADGSVRFISENIDEDVLEALATRAGGEVVGDF